MISFTFPDEAILGKKRHPIPFEYDDISVSGSGVFNLTASKLRKCVGALIKFETGPFRERHDRAGSASTTSGYLRSDGDEYFYSREEAQAFTVVIDTVLGGTTGTLRVTYYG
jgi:hypothetical protein